MRLAGPMRGLTYRVIGAAMAAHNKLGPGLKESVYHHALTLEQEAGLSCQEEKAIEILLDGVSIGLLYLDLLVEDSLVVEVKAISHMLTDEELAQVITYLAATGLTAGVLINFGRKRLEYRRVLPPRKLDAWRNRIRGYVWTPKKA
jgi:GxxExxY protein